MTTGSIYRDVVPSEGRPPRTAQDVRVYIAVIGRAPSSMQPSNPIAGAACHASELPNSGELRRRALYWRIGGGMAMVMIAGAAALLAASKGVPVEESRSVYGVPSDVVCGCHACGCVGRRNHTRRLRCVRDAGDSEDG